MLQVNIPPHQIAQEAVAIYRERLFRSFRRMKQIWNLLSLLSMQKGSPTQQGRVILDQRKEILAAVEEDLKKTVNKKNIDNSNQIIRRLLRHRRLLNPAGLDCLKTTWNEYSKTSWFSLGDFRRFVSISLILNWRYGWNKIMIKASVQSGAKGLQENPLTSLFPSIAKRSGNIHRPSSLGPLVPLRKFWKVRLVTRLLFSYMVWCCGWDF